MYKWLIISCFISYNTFFLCNFYVTPKSKYYKPLHCKKHCINMKLFVGLITTYLTADKLNFTKSIMNRRWYLLFHLVIVLKYPAPVCNCLHTFDYYYWFSKPAGQFFNPNLTLKKHEKLIWKYEKNCNLGFHPWSKNFIKFDNIVLQTLF